MTDTQVYDLIEKNGVSMVLLRDYAHNKLHEITAHDCHACIHELKEALGNFKGLNKIMVVGRANEKTPWTKGFTWGLEFQPGEAKAISGIGASMNGGIGALEYIGMYTSMMEKQMALQTQILESKMKENNNDPTKWLPLINAFAPTLGLKTASIQGPPATSLHLGDTKTNTMTNEEITKAIGVRLESLAGKIKGSQMLSLTEALDGNADLNVNVDKISKLILCVNKNPGLLDMALNFMNNG